MKKTENRINKRMKRKNKCKVFISLLIICSMFLGTVTVYATEHGTENAGLFSSETGIVPDESISVTPTVPAEAVATDEGNGDESLAPGTTDVPAVEGDDLSQADSSAVTDESDIDDLGPDENAPELPDESVIVPPDMSEADAALSLTPTPSLTPSPSPTPTEELLGAAQAIEEGYYIFRVFPDGATLRTMAVKGNVADNNVNLVSGTYSQSNVRLFYVQKSTGNYYKIRNLHTGKYLQVQSNKKDDGTSVVQSSLNTSTAQQWQFVPAGNGYRIVGRTSGKALNVTGASTKLNTTLEIRKIANKRSQVWYPMKSFVKISGAGTEIKLPGTQRYTGKAVTPDVTLKVYGKKLVQGTDYTLAYTNNVKTGTAKIVISGAGEYQGSRTGTFRIFNYVTSIQSGGVYYIIPKVNLSQTMTVTENRGGNNTHLSITKRANARFNKFTILKTTDGSYKILSGNPLYTLMSAGSGNLKMYSQQNTSQQRWTLTKDSQGTFTIINKATGQAVAASGSSMGSALITEPKNGKDVEKFYLTKTTTEFPADPVYVPLYNNNYIEQFELQATVTPVSLNSKISVYKQESAANTPRNSSGGYVDFKNKKIGLYRGFAFGEKKSTLASASIPFKLQANQSYTVQLIRASDNTVHFVFSDPSSGNTVSVKGTSFEAGRAWGTLKCIVDSGNVKTSGLRIRNLGSTRPTLAMVGDSYLEGTYLHEDINSRYASFVTDHLNGDVFMCCRGGATSTLGVQWFNRFLFDTVKPRYILIAFGMNDRDYTRWVDNMQKMISLAEANNVIPILATIPPRVGDDVAEGNAVHEQMSAWVRQSGYRYIDVAKALTLNHDGVTPNESLMLSDRTHPNKEGHLRIFEEFRSKLGDIY